MQAAPKKKKIENQAGCAKENKIENQAGCEKHSPALTKEKECHTHTHTHTHFGTRSLNTLLIPIDILLSLLVEEFYGTRHYSNSFSKIDVGSGF
jgi:hypothetical protein